jgi:hypothetical protein
MFNRTKLRPVPDGAPSRHGGQPRACQCFPNSEAEGTEGALSKWGLWAMERTQFCLLRAKSRAVENIGGGVEKGHNEVTSATRRMGTLKSAESGRTMAG